MPKDQFIPTYKDFNHSLKHLHLKPVSADRPFYIFSWQYTENRKISYPLSRQDYYDITFFLEADFSHQMNASVNPIRNHTLHLLTPGQAEHFETRTVCRPSGFAIYFKPEFIFATAQRRLVLSELPFLKASKNNVFYLTPEESADIKALFSKMIEEQDQGPGAADIIRHYIFILLYKLKHLSPKPLVPAIPEESLHLADRFEELIEKNFLQISAIDQYADLLHVSPNHLSETIKKKTGKSPKQILQEAILLEAKLLLKQDNLSISEIAFQLNFHDAPHFSRFFRKHQQQSPLEFRKQYQSKVKS